MTYRKKRKTLINSRSPKQDGNEKQFGCVDPVVMGLAVMATDSIADTDTGNRHKGVKSEECDGPPSHFLACADYLRCANKGGGAGGRALANVQKRVFRQLAGGRDDRCSIRGNDVEQRHLSHADREAHAASGLKVLIYGRDVGHHALPVRPLRAHHFVDVLQTRERNLIRPALLNRNFIHLNKKKKMSCVLKWNYMCIWKHTIQTP